jgi:hypothetical protein
MTNYQNTIIYKIVCDDLNVKDLYVGSTTNFIQRKQKHKNTCNYEKNKYSYNYKVYKIIRDNGNWDNWSMLEIEKYPCNDKNEARTRERYWFEQLQSTMNVALPIIDAEDTKKYMKDYNIINQEHIKENKNIYNEQNKEHMLLIKKNIIKKIKKNGIVKRENKKLKFIEKIQKII